MTTLAEDPRTIFVGQAVRYTGQRAHASFAGVPMERRIEMPVAEDFQLGFSLGLALEGYVPVTFFPRWDFLLLAANQLVNHLDKLAWMGEFRAKLIVRVAVGARAPLDPGPQHTQDHSEAFRSMLRTVPIVKLWDAALIAKEYVHALARPETVIMVEYMEKYG